jgi:hypothetical protein
MLSQQNDLYKPSIAHEYGEAHRAFFLYCYHFCHLSNQNKLEANKTVSLPIHTPHPLSSPCQSQWGRSRAECIAPVLNWEL